MMRAPAVRCMSTGQNSGRTRSEDGDESGGAVPLCKLFSPAARRAVSGDSAAVEERLSADSEQQLGPEHR